MTVRMARTQDLDQMVNMAYDFLLESGQPTTFSESKTRESLAVGLTVPEFFVIVSHEGDTITGMLVGFMGPSLFSLDPQAIEMCWYSSPQHRRGKDGLTMLNRYEEWAIRMGARVISLTYLDDVQDLTKLYERRGYRRSESNFIKEV